MFNIAPPIYFYVTQQWWYNFYVQIIALKITSKEFEANGEK